MRQFYLHPRNGIFYVEFVDPSTGIRLSARSTGTKNRDEALIKASEWLKSGIPTGPKRQTRLLETAIGIENILKSIKKTDLTVDDAMRIVTTLKNRELVDIPVVRGGNEKVLLTDFLELFWTYDKSPYIKEKLAHRHSIGRRHCYESLCRFHHYWTPEFKGRTINSITREDLKNFSLLLSDRGLSSATINKIMAVGLTALKWAFQEGKIPVNPTIGLIGFSSDDAKKRGVLTPQEAAMVFSVEWSDKRAYVGNLVACSTGLRSGEVLSLRREDVGEKVIDVRHSWSSFDHCLKSTKTGESRQVPLLPEVREKLLELIDENPHEEDGIFIFYCLSHDKPMGEAILLDGLKDACRAVGNDPCDWLVDIPHKTSKYDSLWMIRGEKDKNGNLQGNWSDPVQVDDKISVSSIQKAENGNFIEIRYRWSSEKPEPPMVIDTKARRIVFHSHRHYYASRMVDRMTAEQVKRLTGHKSQAVFEGYTDHIISENIDAAMAIGSEVFRDIVSPPTRY
jgi:integrase